MSSVISFVISLCLILQIWKNVLSKFKLNESKHGLNYIYMTMAWSNPGSSDERESQPQTCSLSLRRLTWARQATTLLLSHTCYILKTHMTLYLLGHVWAEAAGIYCMKNFRYCLWQRLYPQSLHPSTSIWKLRISDANSCSFNLFILINYVSGTMIRGTLIRGLKSP